MSVLTANCPSCAAPLEFKAGSTVVLVCPFCRSVVARSDRAVEDLGKVAEIVETESPLKIGLRGKYMNQAFELTGRAQLRHSAGGVWDEWYATFGNGWVGWLAEAQGKFYLTFFQPLAENVILPPFEMLEIGRVVPAVSGSTAYVVAEKGTATSITAEGEIPYKLIPNEQSRYADLSGANNSFGTIDYGTNPPFVFLGKEVSLADIGLESARPAERAAKTVNAAGLGCPNCGGALTLRAPAASERVTCPNCDSLLDVNEGNLKYLNTLKPEPFAYALPIGTVANFKNREPMQIIGATTRSVTIAGQKYFWQEYLLYNPKVGFRWLVTSDNHWNFVEPVALGDVAEAAATASYQGKTCKIFQSAPAEVEHIRGEFYWRVEVGETVWASDYVNAPLMLSKEVSGTQDASEINWSAGTYLTVKEVEAATQTSNLPQPYNVAPNQPFQSDGLLKYSVAMLILLFVVAIVIAPLTSGGGTAKAQSFTLPPMVSATASQIVFSEPFELKGNRNVEIEASAPVSNSFVSIDVDLVNDQNSEIENVSLDVEQYSGIEDGEAWSEGSTSNSAIISSVPAGSYALKVEGTWQNWQQPMPVSVTVKQNSFRGVNFTCALVLLLIMPLLAVLRKVTFESRRWSESMFKSSGASSNSDDE